MTALFPPDFVIKPTCGRGQLAPARDAPDCPAGAYLITSSWDCEKIEILFSGVLLKSAVFTGDYYNSALLNAAHAALG
ncbi:hypothetical protein AB4144_09440 [Rhizobiaceae sp. 2RAB30]